jgi:hypothetical protein
MGNKKFSSTSSTGFRGFGRDFNMGTRNSGDAQQNGGQQAGRNYHRFHSNLNKDKPRINDNNKRGWRP